jgi:hypothetical protein
MQVKGGNNALPVRPAAYHRVIADVSQQLVAGLGGIRPGLI